MRLALTLTASLTLAWLLALAAPGAGPAPAHAATLASVESTSCPAPDRVVKLALSHYRAARVVWLDWRRAKDCLGEQGRLRVRGRPAPDAPAAVWLERMAQWQRQHRDFHARLAKLIAKMRNPGGTSSGVRWLPLARWCGWPSHTLHTLASIIMRESSGRPRALNPSSGCAGLLQIHPCHGVANVFDPEVNLRAGLRLWRASGWAPWAL